MILNKKARLLFITDHLLHVGDLIEGNEYEHYLRDALTTMQYEVKRQLQLEEDKINERTTNQSSTSTCTGRLSETQSKC